MPSPPRRASGSLYYQARDQAPTAATPYTTRGPFPLEPLVASVVWLHQGGAGEQERGNFIYNFIYVLIYGIAGARYSHTLHHARTMGNGSARAAQIRAEFSAHALETPTWIGYSSGLRLGSHYGDTLLHSRK